MVRSVAMYPTHIADMVVEQIYSRDPITCTLQDDARQVLKTMNEKGFRHMPVVEHGNLQGVVSVGDLLKNLLEEAGAQGQAQIWSDLDFI